MRSETKVILDEILNRARNLRRQLSEANFAPDRTKQDVNRYSIGQVSELIGRSPQAIRMAEKDGRIPPPADNPSQNRKYTLSEVNNIRHAFGTQPVLGPDDEPMILSFQSFKGGVGKSTSACHAAQYHARLGYRTLLIDCDPQGSTTDTFGLVPEIDVADKDTLLPFIRGDEDDLEYAIQHTYWDGLDIVPSNLHLYQGEYEMAAAGGEETFLVLTDAINSIKHNYDVIILDPPPSLGMLSLNVMCATRGIIIPVPPSMYDFASTVAFIEMLYENVMILTKHINIDYEFVRVMITRYDESKNAHRNLVQLIRAVFGHLAINSVFLESAEIANASFLQRTVYEMPSAITSSKVRKRCLNSLDRVNEEIELLIRKTWPSHTNSLRDAGLAV